MGSGKPRYIKKGEDFVILNTNRKGELKIHPDSILGFTGVTIDQLLTSQIPTNYHGDNYIVQVPLYRFVDDILSSGKYFGFCVDNGVYLMRRDFFLFGKRVTDEQLENVK